MAQVNPTGDSHQPTAGLPQSSASVWADRVLALKIFLQCSTSSGNPGPRLSFGTSPSHPGGVCSVGIGVVGGFIIDGVNRIRFHQPLPQNFWWLVGIEMALAVLIGVLSRTVDYFDSLLADRYTHRVGVEGCNRSGSRARRNCL